MNSTVKTSGRFSKSRGLRASVPFLPSSPPPPSFYLFALALFSARPECEKLLSAARISFASYGNACYAGYFCSCSFHEQELVIKPKKESGNLVSIEGSFKFLVRVNNSHPLWGNLRLFSSELSFHNSVLNDGAIEQKRA